MRYSLLSSIFFMSCISLFIFLGLWQLDRADEKKNIVKLNQEREAKRAIKDEAETHEKAALDVIREEEERQRAVKV